MHLKEIGMYAISHPRRKQRRHLSPSSRTKRIIDQLHKTRRGLKRKLVFFPLNTDKSVSTEAYF